MCKGGEKHGERVKCLAQAHNTMSLARESSAVTMRPPRELNLTNLVRWIDSLIE